MRLFKVWEGDLNYGTFWEDELWMFEGVRWIRFIDISV